MLVTELLVPIFQSKLRKYLTHFPIIIFVSSISVVSRFSFISFIDDGIITEGAFRILLAVKNYPRLTSLSFDRILELYDVILREYD